MSVAQSPARQPAGTRCASRLSQLGGLVAGDSGDKSGAICTSHPGTAGWTWQGKPLLTALPWEQVQHQAPLWARKAQTASAPTALVVFLG